MSNAARNLGQAISDPRVILGVVILSFNLFIVGWLATSAAESAGVRFSLSRGLHLDFAKLGEFSSTIRNLPHDAGRTAMDMAGNVLSQFIRHASATAAATARPLPADIRATLAPYFPARILDKVRWTTMDSSRLSLDSAVLGMDGHAAALTLGHVIVFRKEREALSDWKTWAHELVHVMQYDEMGVDFFAITYIRSFGRQLERPAYHWSDHVELMVERSRKVRLPRV